MRNILITLLICLVSIASAEQKYVTTTADNGASGTLGDPWKLSDANTYAEPGDTVNIRAGLYTTAINPTQTGTAGNPIVFRNYQTEVCSLNVAGYVIQIQNVDYIIVQGIRAQLRQGWGVDYNIAYVKNTDHSAIMDCYLYGGTMLDAGFTSYYSVVIDDALYFRFINNWVDRQDPFITDGSGFGARPDYRGDGVGLFGDSRFCIIEGNTIINVSHFAFSTADTYPVGNSFNIWRNNVGYNSHGIYGTDRGVLNLFEGNRGYSPGQVADRGGVTMQSAGIRNIIRHNMYYDDSVSIAGAYRAPGGNNSGITGTEYATFIDNRIYHNVFMGISRTPLSRFSLYLVNNEGDWDFGRNVFANNIIAYPNSVSDEENGASTPFFYQNNYGTFDDTLKGNLVWAQTIGDTIANYAKTYYTLASLKSTFTNRWQSSNFEATPVWLDSTSLRGLRTFQTTSASPCIDRAVALTIVTSNSSSTTINVSDPYYFHYDWGASPYDRGDSILVGTDRVEIDSIDYTGSRIIAKSSVTVAAGDSIWVIATYSTENAAYTSRMSGTRPDVGSYEYVSGTTPETPTKTTLVSPSNGSIQAIPVTLKWRTVSTATQYWVSVGNSDWSQETWYYTTAPDTDVSVSNLTANTTYNWNVNVNNNGVWSGFCSDSSFITGDAPEFETYFVDWNKSITFYQLPTHTAFGQANLQRINHTLVVTNPNGYQVSWAANTHWLGKTSPPLNPSQGDTTVYYFIRYGTQVLGFELSDMSSEEGGSGTSSGWVTANFLQLIAVRDSILNYAVGLNIATSQVLMAGGIDTIYSVPTVPSINLPTNTESVAGIVVSGTGQVSKVWKTDASGVPQWRDDEGGSGIGGVGIDSATISDDSLFLWVAGERYGPVGRNIEIDTLAAVVTSTATTLTATSAQLNGTVDANSTSTTARFVYGTDRVAFTDSVTADQSPVTGTTATTISKTITGLTAETEYFFKAVGSNIAGYVRGGLDSLTTTSESTPSPVIAADTVTSNDRGAVSFGTTEALVGTDPAGMVYAGQYNGSENQTGFGFQIALNQGAMIDSAFIYFYINRNYGQSTDTVWIRGYDVDNLSAFNASDGHALSSHATVYNDVRVGATNVTEYEINRFDVTSIVQHIVDRGSWASGNYLGFVLSKGTTQLSDEFYTIYDYEYGNSSRYPRIIVYAHQ